MTVIAIKIRLDGDDLKTEVYNHTDASWAIENAGQYAKELKAVSEVLGCLGEGLEVQADAIHCAVIHSAIPHLTPEKQSA